MGGVFASRAMASLAIGPKVEPRRLIQIFFGVEVLHFEADVTGVAVLVPHLHRHSADLVGIANVERMEPLLAEHVPGGRQHHDLAAGKRGQVMLDASVPQRVIHAVFLLLAGEIRLGDIKGAVALAQAIGCASQLYPAA
jgi:hypothetical protein